jgi:hypothetical protein
VRLLVVHQLFDVQIDEMIRVVEVGIAQHERLLIPKGNLDSN